MDSVLSADGRRPVRPDKDNGPAGVAQHHLRRSRRSGGTIDATLGDSTDLLSPVIDNQFAHVQPADTEFADLYDAEAGAPDRQAADNQAA